MMKKIPLGSGQYTLVDDADYVWLNQYMWFSNTSGYAQNAIGRSKLCNAPCSSIPLMHRLILGLESGDHRECDHINHNIVDNRRCNLRICSRAENNHNRGLTKKHTTSKHKGVHWNKQCQKWQAGIKVNGKRKYLGLFSKEKYAAQAYNLAAKKHFGEFACLNQI